MVVKYVRESFRERAKGAQHDLPPVSRPTFPFPKTQWTRVQVLFLLGFIALLFILDSLQARRQAMHDAVSVTEGVVVAKEIDTDLEDKSRYFVELEMPYDGKDAVTVVAECQQSLWENLSAGTLVSVTYYSLPRDGTLVIRTIEPTASASPEADAQEVVSPDALDDSSAL